MAAGFACLTHALAHYLAVVGIGFDYEVTDLERSADEAATGRDVSRGSETLAEWANSGDSDVPDGVGAGAGAGNVAAFAEWAVFSLSAGLA